MARILYLHGSQAGAFGPKTEHLEQHGHRVVRRPHLPYPRQPRRSWRWLTAYFNQVWFRDAWLRVEAGSRPGRQVLLARPMTTLGSAWRSDVRLDGDVAVEPIHARIERRGQSFFLADAGSAWGTFVNDSPIAGPVVLQSGDLIGVGRSRLLFLRR